jgi:hypothetical protein
MVTNGLSRLDQSPRQLLVDGAIVILTGGDLRREDDMVDHGQQQLIRRRIIHGIESLKRFER